MTRGQPLEGAEPALKPRASREAGSPRAKDQLLCRLEGCWESRPSFPILALKMCQHEGERAGVGLMVGWEGAVADPITCGYLHWDPSPTLSARLLEPWYKPNPHHPGRHQSPDSHLGHTGPIWPALPIPELAMVGGWVWQMR